MAEKRIPLKPIEKSDKRMFKRLMLSVLRFYHHERRWKGQTVQDVMNDFTRKNPKIARRNQRIINEYGLTFLVQLKHQIAKRIRKYNLKAHD